MNLENMKEQKKAADLQYEIRMSEYDNINHYDDEQVKQSVVHSREDIVLLVSYATSIIRILKDIRIILLVTSILFGIYFWLNL